MTKQELIDYCLTLSATYEDYPFENEWCIIRHKQNRKGFAHIYKRSEFEFANLKCEPNESDLLRNIYQDITPAYHMNKTHWNSVKLNGDVSEIEVKRLVCVSYDLIKANVRKNK